MEASDLVDWDALGVARQGFTAAPRNKHAARSEEGGDEGTQVGSDDRGWTSGKKGTRLGAWAGKLLPLITTRDKWLAAGARASSATSTARRVSSKVAWG